MKKNISRLFVTSVEILTMLVSAAISAVVLHVFVFPASFAPSGVDGIATMLQKISGINAGFFSLAINLPLLFIAWFFINKKYLVYTLFFIIASSIFLILLAKIDFYQYTTKGESFLIAVVSGFALGIRTGLMLKIGSSSGGIDIIACIIQKKSIYINVERIISCIGYIIVLISYFVYKDITCILLSFIQMFVFEKSAGIILKDNRSAVEFKVITKTPLEIQKEIINKLKHGVTKVTCIGAYTESDLTILITIVNRRQVADFLSLIKKYPDTFVYYNEVSGVRGNFRWRTHDEVK